MRTGRERVLRACYSFLVPLVRLILRGGISYKEFAKLTRMAFVDVAGQDYGIRGRPTNSSRISAMTGIGRKEVRQMRALISTFDRDPRLELSPLGDVLHRWHTDPKYLSPDGSPRTLSFQTGDGSFADLVRECSRDLPLGAIKVELIRCGAVHEKPDGDLEPLRRYVVPDDVHEQLISSMVFSFRGLASTIAFNTNPTRTSSGRFERIVQSDPISAEDRDLVKKLIRERLEKYTEEIDDLFGTTTTAISSGKRVGVGLFFFEDE